MRSCGEAGGDYGSFERYIIRGKFEKWGRRGG